MTELVIIVICLILNAILSCIEMAFVTTAKPQVKKMAKDGSRPAIRLLHLKRNPERTLSVLQIGITLVGAISAAVGGAGAIEYLNPLITRWFGLRGEVAESISIAVVVLPLTYLSVVFGELVPKSVALRYPLRCALLGGWLLVALEKAFSPVVWLLEASTRLITLTLFSKFKTEKFQDVSEVDFSELSEPHRQYVFNLLTIGKKNVSDILIPWEQVTKVDISEHHFVVLDKIKKSRHTRFPVLQYGKIIGILHTKEFVAETEVSKMDWTELIRPAIQLKPQEQILTALKSLQGAHGHLAIIVDQETPTGIVTIEDIFEEVVGELYDEDDEPRTVFLRTSKIRNLRRSP